MKTLFALLLASMLGITSMASAADPVKPVWTELVEGENSTMYAFTDTTGCQYLVYIHRVGVSIAPRLGTNGKPLCIDTTKPEAESFKSLPR